MHKEPASRVPKPESIWRIAAYRGKREQHLYPHRDDILHYRTDCPCNPGVKKGTDPADPGAGAWYIIQHHPNLADYEEGPAEYSKVDKPLMSRGTTMLDQSLSQFIAKRLGDKS